MNDLEKNALRIAELMGVKTHISVIGAFGTVIAKIPNTGVINKFMEYNGLMPIVFECNRGDSVIKIKKHFVEFWYLGDNETSHYNDYRSNYIITEPEFIETIQECVIKYLELQNANSGI